MSRIVITECNGRTHRSYIIRRSKDGGTLCTNAGTFKERADGVFAWVADSTRTAVEEPRLAVQTTPPPPPSA